MRGFARATGNSGKEKRKTLNLIGQMGVISSFITEDFTMFFKSHRILFLLLVAVCLMCYPAPASSAMKVLSDSALSEITGFGYSDFTLFHDDVTGYDIARIDLNQSVSTFTEIDSMKLGYYDNGTGLGWDQNWTNVSVGTAAQDLFMNGLFFRAEFENINDPVNRQLKSLTVGFTDVTGDLTADFQSLSLAGAAPRQMIGLNTLNFLNTPLALKIIMDGTERGIWLDLTPQPVP